MENTFIYNLSETEYLVFKPNHNYFEVYSGHEASELKKIANYKGGKWIFENMHQRQFFFLLFDQYKVQFGKAVKAYNISLREKPHLYEFRCLRSRVSLKISRIKRSLWQSMYNTFYGR